ncbi:DUF3786 domain-containing protein [Chloroflexota bacterium]
MENKHLILPEQKNYEYAYELAYKLACEKLAKIDDIEQQCRQSGAQYQVIDSKKAIIIQFLNQSYLITLPDIKISLVGSAEEVPTRIKVLILHYFTLAKGTPAANRVIAFSELPEGKVYSPTFSKRTVKPLLDYFGKEPRLLLDAAEQLGGHKADYGDTAVTINAFSYVPITIILWRGDDELAPQGNIVFDATISDYLSTEDITILCETITWKLVRYLRGA